MEESDELKQIRNELKNLENKEKSVFIKKYLKSPYEFYGVAVPKLRAIAKKHKQQNIYGAYNLFDELWNSGNHEEMSLALFLLQNHQKQFNNETWKFLRQRLNKAKTWDHIDLLSSGILAKILSKDISLTSEIKEMSQSKNPWERRTSIVSTIQLIREGRLQLVFLLAEKLVYDEDTYVQKSAGWMLREAGKKERVSTKDFILMHLDMKPTAFSYATEKMPELRVLRKAKKKEGKNKEEK